MTYITSNIFANRKLKKSITFEPQKRKANMCLSIPARIESIEGEMASCSVGEARYNASLAMLDIAELAVGDYVLLHTGFALQKISEEEALETLKLFDEFEAFNEQLDKEEQQTGKRIV